MVRSHNSSLTSRNGTKRQKPALFTRILMLPSAEAVSHDLGDLAAVRAFDHHLIRLIALVDHKKFVLPARRDKGVGLNIRIDRRRWLGVDLHVCFDNVCAAGFDLIDQQLQGPVARVRLARPPVHHRHAGIVMVGIRKARGHADCFDPRHIDQIVEQIGVDAAAKFQ